MQRPRIPFSVLDLAPILKGGTAADAFRRTVDLAQQAEKLGFYRYWLAEHHNMRGIASAATSVLIGHVAGQTSTIRVGSGGIMLPNHSPLVIAEQFGTLASLYPGRIDLGLGRAPGSDQVTARALRRDLRGGADSFPEDILELQSYFQPPTRQLVRAVPGGGLEVEFWLLGSSLFSAQLAAQMGLPYAFALHFAPEHFLEAIKIYRANFQPSEKLKRPHVMVGLNIFAADRDAEASILLTSLQQQFINLRRGVPSELQPPVEKMDWTPWEQQSMEGLLAGVILGSRATVYTQLKNFIEKIMPDEILVTAQIFDHAARVRSFEIVAEVRDRLFAS
ncbi:MAG: LLM class flavin-dependent oxidoreductase [Chthoniobacterales bacterium]